MKLNSHSFENEIFYSKKFFIYLFFSVLCYLELQEIQRGLSWIKVQSVIKIAVKNK